MAKKIEVEEEEDGSDSGSTPRYQNTGAIPRTARNADAAIRRRRRLDSLNLETSNISNGFRNMYSDSSPNTSQSSPHDAMVEGQELYLHFLHEQFRHQGLQDNERFGLEAYHDPSHHLEDNVDGCTQVYSCRSRRMSMNLQNFQNPLWRQAGRELKALAERFAQSQERSFVQERASQVNVDSLDFQKFTLLLRELFPNGQITRERIVVLFFFCSDVAILSARKRLDQMLSKIVQWTLVFIREQVCDWVQRNGGWQNVLSTGLSVVQSVAVVGMCVAVMTACFFYVRKHLG